MKQKYNAIYLRLSSEDEKKLEKNKASNSIINQREIIQSFIRKNSDLQGNKILEFVDDGYTGVNFDRPAMKNLLHMIENKQIDTMIVKDLSRLGRNYIKVGEFIDNLFPLYEGRLIAVNDNFDTKDLKDNVPGIFVAFKLITNAYYSVELSGKAKSARMQQIQRGKSIMARPPYGYWKSSEKKGTLIVDGESAAVVKSIFQMYLDGFSAYRIARILNENKVPSPSKRLILHGMVHFKEDLEEKLSWSSGAVLDILKNQVMIGHMVGNKCTKLALGNKSCKALPKDKWIIVKNTHEPIIDEKSFQTIQQMIAEKRTKDIDEKREYSDYLLKGKLYCSRCNRVMTSYNNKNDIFICRKCLTLSNIATKIKKYTLLEGISGFLRIREMLLGECNLKSVNNNKPVKKEKENYSKRRKDQELFLTSLYEQYVHGIITKEIYLSKKAKIQTEITNSKELVNRQEVKNQQLQNDCYGYQPLHKQMKLHESIDCLTNDFIKKYIDRIIVYGEREYKIIWNDSDFFI